MSLPPYCYAFPAMGTECQFILHADDERLADRASELAMTEVWRIEHKYSRYADDSTLAEINRAATKGGRIGIDAETATLFDFALKAFNMSDGLFDITSGLLRHVWDFSAAALPSPAAIKQLLPLIGLMKIGREDNHLLFPVPGMELDLGGIGKEYAVDRSVDICRGLGITSGLIDLGGDVRSIGPRPDGRPWEIGIRHPRRPDASLGNIRLTSGAVATSGDYERYIEVAGKRYCHILNPKTGWPTTGLTSVSVMAEQCMLAGTLSTIAMLKGNTGKAWLMKLGVQHCWVDEQLHSGGNLTPNASQEN